MFINACGIIILFYKTIIGSCGREICALAPPPVGRRLIAVQSNLFTYLPIPIAART